MAMPACCFALEREFRAAVEKAGGTVTLKSITGREAPAADATAAPTTEAAPTGPMKSADGENSLSGEGKQINVKLAGKGAQTCKSS